MKTRRRHTGCAAKKIHRIIGTCRIPISRHSFFPRCAPLCLSQAPIFILTSLKEYIEKVRNSMPELPEATRARLLSMGLSERDADVLMTVDAGREVGFDGEPGKGAVAYFNSLVRGRDPKIVINWCGTHFHRLETGLSACHTG